MTLSIVFLVVLGIVIFILTGLWEQPWWVWLIYWLIYYFFSCSIGFWVYEILKSSSKSRIRIYDIICSILLSTPIVLFIFSIDARCWFNDLLPIKKCAERYCEMIYTQIKQDNLDNVITISYNIGEWGDDKSKEEREQFENAMQQWADENPYKAERIEDYFRKHRDVIPK